MASLEEKSKEIVERGVALPLWTCELGEIPEDNIVPEGYAGRMILPRVHGQRFAFKPGEYLKAANGREHLESILTEDDILYVPLFVGETYMPADWPPKKMADFDEHMDLIATVGPRIKAVLTGNQGPELSYRKEGRSPVENTALCGKFIRHVDNLFELLGVRTAVGPMDRDIAQDCYLGGHRHMQQMLIACEAIAFCFCGFTLVPGMYFDNEGEEIPESVKLIAEWGRGKSADMLRKYLSGDGAVFWGDIYEDGGLEHDNDKLMAEAGFKAGVY